MKNVAADWLKSRTLLFDGAMGTMFYARGIFINRCYDELNLTEPEMVRELHEEYLMAGAEAIETNTFGATAPRLARYGLAEKVGAINRAAVVIAHRAVRHAKENLPWTPLWPDPSVRLPMLRCPRTKCGTLIGSRWRLLWKGRVSIFLRLKR